MPRAAVNKSYREGALKRSALTKLRDVPDLCVRKRWGGPFTTAGDPDLTGCYRGQHFEIELKQPGEVPTVLQVKRLLEWSKAGAITGVATTVDEVFQILDIKR